MVHLQSYDLAGFKSWVLAASPGMKTSGITRVAFGIPRSFIEMEIYGLLFKRYLLNDPYNPVSLMQLLFAHFWKLLLFGPALVALAINIWRSPQGRRNFSLVVIGALPLLAFAIRFSGSDIERYLSLYPLFFLTSAYVLGSPASRKWLNTIVLAFFIISGVINFYAMATWRLNREQEKIAQRVTPLISQLNPKSWIFTVNEQDELLNFKRSFPFNALSNRADVNVIPVTRLNTDQVAIWRNEFHEGTKLVWAAGGTVWLSNRLFHPHHYRNGTGRKAMMQECRGQKFMSFFRNWKPRAFQRQKTASGCFRHLLKTEPC